MREKESESERERERRATHVSGPVLVLIRSYQVRRDEHGGVKCHSH